MGHYVQSHIEAVRHGLLMAVLAMLCGALWAAYMATHHEQLHGAFEAQVENAQKVQRQQQMEGMAMDGMVMDTSAHSHGAGAADDHHGGDSKVQSDASSGHASGGHDAGAQHSHSGNLAKDAMQRLLRGHIHFMGIGVLAAVLLLIVALTSLKACWKKLLGYTLGFGALLYPPAWILMGFRTVELGPQAAEASVMWLFGPAVGLLLGSMAVLCAVLLIEWIKWDRKNIFRFLFEEKE